MAEAEEYEAEDRMVEAEAIDEEDQEVSDKGEK